MNARTIRRAIEMKARKEARKQARKESAALSAKDLNAVEVVENTKNRCPANPPLQCNWKQTAATLS